MSRPTRWLFFVIIDIPIVWALFSTLFMSDGLYAIGGWFAVLGHFLAVFGTALLLITAIFLCVNVLLLVPLMTMAWLDIEWAQETLTRVENWFTPHDGFFHTDGYDAEKDKTMWQDIFDARLSYRASLRENICTAVQMGALPIAAFLILVILKIF